jgi:hypothetical protein
MTGQPFRQRLTVTIDTLVLRDFPAGAREAIAGSLQMELQRLLAAAGNGFGSSRSVTAVAARQLRVPVGASPHQVGTLAAGQIARGVLP